VARGGSGPFNELGSIGAGVYVGGGWFPILRCDWVKLTDFRSVSRHTQFEFTIGYLF
jgi:hypothetical protein